MPNSFQGERKLQTVSWEGGAQVESQGSHMSIVIFRTIFSLCDTLSVALQDK